MLLVVPEYAPADPQALYCMHRLPWCRIRINPSVALFSIPFFAFAHSAALFCLGLKALTANVSYLS